MVSRTRTRVAATESGRRKFSSGAAWVNFTRYHIEESCTDNIASGDNWPFNVTRATIHGGILNGIGNGAHSGLSARYENFPCGPVSCLNNPVYFPAALYSSSSNATYATLLLRLTNPSRPVVDVPVFVAELKDFPKLFKIAGDTAFKTIAKANLSYWFGWKILASDLMKFANFSDIVNKRCDELKRLYDGGLKCTKRLDDVSARGVGSNHIYSNSNGTYWLVEPNYVHTCQIWGHVKWYPTTKPPKTSSEMIALARRAAFGLTIDPATAWELIPFSWMVDWSLNIGTYLMANRNIVPARYDDLCIMRHETKSCAMRTASTSDPNLTSGREPVMHREHKSRTPVSGASLTAELPFLTLRQLSILGSLAVLKGGGKTFRI